MVTLASALGINDAILALSASTTAAPGDRFGLNDEMVEFVGYEISAGTSRRIRQSKTENRARWLVYRGVGETQAAAHASGTTLLGAAEAFVVGASTTQPSPIPVGGGGVTNDAPNHAIAVSDGTNLTGSLDLTWGIDLEGDPQDGVLGLSVAENSTADIRALGLGAQLQLTSGEGDATHVGGEISLTTGDSVGNGGGNMVLVTGGDSDGGDGGSITIQTGDAPDGESGEIALRVGTSTSGVGGDVNIVAGTGQTGSGGSVVIQAGAKVTGGSHGSVQIYSGEGSAAIDVGTTGVGLSGGVGLYGATPVAQGAAIADATTAVDVIPRLNELLAYLRSRGDIAT